MEDLDQLPADALTLFREMLDGAQTEVDMVSLAAPTERDDQHWRDWFDEAGRRGASPKWAARRWAAHETADISGYLGDITVPTVIIHREGNLIVSPRQADELAAAIPDAELRMLPGSDNLIYAGAVDEIVDAVLEFAGRPIGEGAHDRALLTVLFTDIVGSTDHVAELGDSRWATVLDVHDSLAGRVLERHRGTLVKTTGDGLLVTFDSPGDAVRCAAALRDDLRGLNIDSRSGIHVGEVERRTDDVGGIAVHLAARVMDQAEPAEILVSGAVPPLMLGTDITFVDKGTHDLKGVPGRWQLLAARI